MPGEQVVPDPSRAKSTLQDRPTDSRHPVSVSRAWPRANDVGDPGAACSTTPSSNWLRGKRCTYVWVRRLDRTDPARSRCGVGTQSRANRAASGWHVWNPVRRRAAVLGLRGVSRLPCSPVPSAMPAGRARDPRCPGRRRGPLRQTCAAVGGPPPGHGEARMNLLRGTTWWRSRSRTSRCSGRSLVVHVTVRDPHPGRNLRSRPGRAGARQQDAVVVVASGAEHARLGRVLGSSAGARRGSRGTS